MNNQQTKYQRISAILWPSFIVAGIANSFFFTLFDPEYLVPQSGLISLSKMGTYSVGFFAFWIMTSLSSLGTHYFLKPRVGANNRVNRDNKHDS